MNGVLRLDLLTRDQRDELEREFARVPSALYGRNRHGIDPNDTLASWARPEEASRKRSQKRTVGHDWRAEHELRCVQNLLAFTARIIRPRLRRRYPTHGDGATIRVRIPRRFDTEAA